MGAEEAVAYLTSKDPARWHSRVKAFLYLEQLWEREIRPAPPPLTIERNSTGGHRLVWDDGSSRAVGNWNAYCGIATLEVAGVTYLSVTEYFEGSLPVGVPFVVTPVR